MNLFQELIDAPNACLDLILLLISDNVNLPEIIVKSSQLRTQMRSQTQLEQMKMTSFVRFVKMVTL